MIVKTSPNGQDPVLSLFSHVPVPTQGTRMREQWHPISISEELIPLTCAQRIPLTGGHRFRRHRNIEGSFSWYSWWALSPRYVWQCLISDVLTHGGAVNGGLTQSPDCYGGQPLTGSSSSHEFRTGGYEMTEDLLGPVPMCPRGSTDRPKMYNIAIERYFFYRGNTPSIQRGTLSDSADPHYESYVAGNPSDLSLWS